ncbi:hypothetical protein P3L51_03540 [Streptomyces sp. PSRA5]|uniref:hypothetical protein n=1 Tax=Streptomyces panacea TaxID=3035064 RepID=UPI00339CCA58
MDDELPVNCACSPTENLLGAEVRRLERCERVVVIDARQTGGDAKLTTRWTRRLGVAAGTGMGGVHTLLAHDELPRTVVPHRSPRCATRPCRA